MEKRSGEVSRLPSFLDGGGAMAAAIIAYRWDGTELGPIDDWPAALKTTMGMTLTSRFPQCIVWGEALVTIPNDAFLPILGAKPSALGRSFADVWAEVWADIGPIADRALGGEATFIEDFPLEIERGAGPEQAWFTFCYSPIRDEHGKVVGFLDTVVETTDTVRANMRSHLLAGELAHRMRNLLAIFQTIARRALADDVPREQARDQLDQRIVALAAANDLLVRRDWNEVPLDEVIAKALAPHSDGSERISASGPPVRIGGKQALSLALAINELATNAIKYGALSVPEGRVRLHWEAGIAGSDAHFCLVWQEEGGPAVAEPTRRGFGTRLIARVLPEDFGGTAALLHLADGVRLELMTRMDRLI